ncbi:type II toxin-antitoxin system RelE/ParE family toxin [Limnohabitans sp.]|uniref:type II toxin-antitoxin system RelE/ParE family toxin n=1 Tax=Limnohabitans sp. TaxID=1907725 RepID=UPI0025B85FB9|nr:type II toxin-antitoxin system RelE/ParE family toxin [Limnohabitans sp.]
MSLADAASQRIAIVQPGGQKAACPRQKTLDEAIKAILQNPQLGEEKKGDHTGVFVYKFKLNGQETLLAYELQPHKTAPIEAMLLAVGPHENFYVALKR